jgi:hypothetical protein
MNCSLKAQKAQAVLEYVLLSALLIVSTVVFWTTVARDVPDTLTQELEDAIGCMTDYLQPCQ